MPKVVYAQKFCKEWLKDPLLISCLRCRTPADGSEMDECRYCGHVLGFKYSGLKVHGNSAKHKTAVGHISRQQTLKLAFQQADQAHDAKGRTALSIAEHTSVRTAYHLNGICKKCFAGHAAARHYKVHQSKCSAVLKNVLSPHFRDDFAQDISELLYSLIIDKSTDISVTKILAVSLI